MLQLTAIRRARIPLEARVLDVGNAAPVWLFADMNDLATRMWSGLTPTIRE